MLKKNSFHEPLRQFQPNLAGNMPGMGFRFVQIKGMNKESSKIFLS